MISSTSCFGTTGTSKFIYMKISILCLTFILSFCICIEAFGNEEKKSESTLLTEEPISLFSVFTEIPETSWDTLKTSFSKDSIDDWALILSSTAILYHYDEDILNAVQEDGREMGIGNDDGTKPLFEVFGFPVRFPTDTGSSLYFLGDGITHFTIAGSFLGYGYFTETNKAYNTGLQIIHGMTVSTLLNQILKRSFGRQSPNKRTEPRGAWRPYPSPNTYMRDTEAFDAMPSGHIMTATLTFTIIRENYPEYDCYLLPLEITWLSLLGWQMVNNGVHWASDYPLGIAMGYVIGKASTRLGKRDKKEEEKPDEVSWYVLPGNVRGTSTLNLIVNF